MSSRASRRSRRPRLHELLPWNWKRLNQAPAAAIVAARRYARTPQPRGRPRMLTMSKDPVTIRLGDRARDMGTLADVGPPVQTGPRFGVGGRSDRWRRVAHRFGLGPAGMRGGSRNVASIVAKNRARATVPRRRDPRKLISDTVSSSQGCRTTPRVSSPGTWPLP